jgi:hypothetical protein
VEVFIKAMRMLTCHNDLFPRHYRPIPDYISDAVFKTILPRIYDPTQSLQNKDTMRRVLSNVEYLTVKDKNTPELIDSIVKTMPNIKQLSLTNCNIYSPNQQ